MALTPASAHVVLVGADAGDADAVARALEAGGVAVGARTSVEPEEASLTAALAGDFDVVVVVGGPADATGHLVRRAVARAFGVPLALSDRMLAVREELARRADRFLETRDERLALLPKGARVLEAAGAEPGWALQAGARTVVVVPAGSAGRAVAERHLAAVARSAAGGRPVQVTRLLRTAGATAESVEARVVEALRSGPADVEAAVVEVGGEVCVRLRARGAEPEVGARLDEAERAVRSALGADCYGRDGEGLESAVAGLLRARGLMLAVAESCTGGLLGHRLTNLPGSSAWFERGVLVYSNRAKQELLGVPEAVLREHGAVSAPCAEAMVRGITARSGAACGLAITGIAGPDGGTPAKPVGTVFIGAAAPGGVTVRRFLFRGDRSAIKWQSTQAALDLLRRALLEEPRS